MDRESIIKEHEKLMDDFNKTIDKICEDYKNRLNKLVEEEKKLKNIK